MIGLAYTEGARELNRKGGTTMFLESGAMLAACSNSVQAFTDASGKLIDLDPTTQVSGLADLQNAQTVSNELHATISSVAHQVTRYNTTVGRTVRSVLSVRTDASNLMVALSAWQLEADPGTKTKLAALLPLKPVDYEFLSEGWPDAQVKRTPSKYAQSWSDFSKYVLGAGALKKAWDALETASGIFLVSAPLPIPELQKMAGLIQDVTTALNVNKLGKVEMEKTLPTVLISFLYAIQRYAKIGSDKDKLQSTAALNINRAPATGGATLVTVLENDNLASCLKDVDAGIESLWLVLGVDTLPVMEVTANNKTPTAPV
jgi:hypothetical protein